MSNDGDQLEDWVARGADPTLGTVCQHQWEQRPLGVERNPLLHEPCPHKPVERVFGPDVDVIRSPDGYDAMYLQKPRELCREHLAMWRSKKWFEPLEPQSIQATLDNFMPYKKLEALVKTSASNLAFLQRRVDDIEKMTGLRPKDLGYSIRQITKKEGDD